MSFEMYVSGKTDLTLDEERRYIERGLAKLETEQKVLVQELHDIGQACDQLRERLQEIAEKGTDSTMNKTD